MKYLLLIILLTLSACHDSETLPDELTDIELCMEQGGEWQGECVFEGEKCFKRAACKANGALCPCEMWVREFEPLI